MANRWPTTNLHAHLGDGFHRTGWEIHRELQPVPFLGDLKKAKIVLLMLNPSATFGDYLSTTDEPFQLRLNQTLSQQSASPCLAFDIAFYWSSWFGWYESKFRSPVLDVAREKGVSYREVLGELAAMTAILELVPYYSNNGRDLPLTLIDLFESSNNARAAADQLITTASKDDRLVVMWWAADKWRLNNEESDHYRKLQKGRQLKGKEKAFELIKEKLRYAAIPSSH